MSEKHTHAAICLYQPVSCTHQSRGCPWTGLREDLDACHLPSCLFETMKGFFTIHDAQLSDLRDEIAILHHRNEALEGIVHQLNKDAQAMRIALGPWYRPDGPAYLPSYAVQRGIEPAVASPPMEVQTSSPGSANPLIHQVFTAEPVITSIPDPLAHYFPPEVTTRSHSQARGHRGSLSLSADHSNGYRSQALIAPINLTTDLEGSFEGLRESVVTLSVAVDALNRRHDVELRNESGRLNEEISRLNYALNGVRIQVAYHDPEG